LFFLELEIYLRASIYRERYRKGIPMSNIEDFDNGSIRLLEKHEILISEMKSFSPRNRKEVYPDRNYS